jgi:peptide/nickel transport system substrate-binding protein
MTETRVSRREFLRVSALAAAGSVLAACAPAAPTAAPITSGEPAAPAAPPAAPAAGEEKEAPALAARVEAGELPPLSERLPANPLVVTPWETIGQYGGTWRMGLLGGGDGASLDRTIGYDYLFRWDLDYTRSMPNVLESYEVSEDASGWTFHLRKGMKWSDGVDFTAADLMFWWEDFQSNVEIMPGGPAGWTKVGGEPGVWTKVDDYTIDIQFPGPNGLFHARMAEPDAGWPMVALPKHWMEKYHKDYNPDVDTLVAEEGVEDWVTLFQNHRPQFQENNRPTLCAWYMSSAYGEETSVVRASRNPYYWKVDPDGRQLPYIDEVMFDVAQDVEVLVLKAMNGEIDCQGRHIATAANKATFAEYREKGDYRFVTEQHTSANRMCLYLNLCHKDPLKREVFRNKDFRIGLSHAMNRQELIDTVWMRTGEPYQVAPMRDDKFFHEQLATQYLEYDPDLANEHLDAAGLTERDGEGFRLLSDGTRLTFFVEVTTALTDMIDALELLRTQWQAVGIDMQSKVEDRTLFYERHEANEQDASVWSGEGGRGFAIILTPKNYVPYHTAGSRFALPWAYWYTNPNLEVSEEPPDIVKRQLELYSQVLTVASDDERDALMRQVLDIAADQFYQIGISTPDEGYMIVSNKMHNVPEMVGSWSYPTPGPSNPEQYWLEA